MRVYCSEHVHSSIDKGVITLGLGLRSLRKIECNDRFEMIPEKLAEAIDEDIAAGYLPICVIPTVGTTSTSSVDPVDAIADICEKQGIWLHVDTAYAGATAIVPEFRHHFKGWERADSIVVNPHKWLFTPFDLSVLYCKDLSVLKDAFSLVAEYLKTSDEQTVKNGMDYGIQLGRRFRALQFWFIIRYFGVEGMQARLRDHCRLARLFGSARGNTARDWPSLRVARGGRGRPLGTRGKRGVANGGGGRMPGGGATRGQTRPCGSSRRISATRRSCRRARSIWPRSKPRGPTSSSSSWSNAGSGTRCTFRSAAPRRGSTAPPRTGRPPRSSSHLRRMQIP